MTATTCRSCGAAIVWAITATGKRAPLDADPSEAGTFVLVDTGGDPVIALRAADDRRPGHTFHFATCPQADTWRRR